MFATALTAAPVEDHDLVAATSWADEDERILTRCEVHLKK